jgi:hypothetical protein
MCVRECMWGGGGHDTGSHLNNVGMDVCRVPTWSQGLDIHSTGHPSHQVPTFWVTRHIHGSQQQRQCFPYSLHSSVVVHGKG